MLQGNSQSNRPCWNDILYQLREKHNASTVKMKNRRQLYLRVLSTTAHVKFQFSFYEFPLKKKRNPLILTYYHWITCAPCFWQQLPLGSKYLHFQLFFVFSTGRYLASINQAENLHSSICLNHSCASLHRYFPMQAEQLNRLWLSRSQKTKKQSTFLRKIF